jgi:UDP-N-acetylmuramyl pentapeptide synthase
MAKVVKAAMRTAAKVWTVGTGPNDNIRLLDARPESSGCRVRLSFKGRIHEYLFPVASIGLVRNSALAFAAIVAMGFDAEEASARMPHVRLPASVMQVEPLRTRTGALVTLVDDSWNAEVMSMRNAMSFVRSYRGPGNAPVARKVGVLGRIVNLGEQAEAMHRGLAEPLLASGIAHLVTHGDEMRWLREEVPVSLLGPHFDDAAELTLYLGEYLRDGDLLLVKGDRDRSDFGTIPSLLKKL